MKLVNVIIFFMRSLLAAPKRVGVLFNKVLAHVIKQPVSDDYLVWLEREAKDICQFCISRDSLLWGEAVQFVESLEQLGKHVVRDIDYKVGGAGSCQLLYFLVRRRKPLSIVETGVALGYSSATFLEALGKNGFGKLYSSDFPYPGIPNSDQLVGRVVPENLRSGWTLLLDGDKNNLVKISQMIGEIDFLHYDSDKSYSGRARAMSLLADKLASDAIIVFDDIHENTHFLDLVDSMPNSPWHVFKFRNKYIGTIGIL